MQSNSRRNLISFLRERFQRNYITIINASVTVLLIGTAIIVLLSRASFLQRKTAEESVVNLAGMTASEVQSTYANFFNIARTVSQIMRNYQIIDIDQRRNYFDDVMQGILNSNQALISIFTILKPNELDDMDAHYANTEYSDDTGQYITGFSREHGWVEKKSYPEYKKLLSHFDNSLSVSNDTIIGEPRYMTLGWGNRVKDTWVLDIQVPIMLQTYHTIGFVGVTINLEQLQTLVVSRNPYITGRTMVCSEDGALIAHYDPDLWGHNLSGAGIGDDLFPADIQSSAYQTALDAIDHQSPVIKAAGNTLIISYPLGAITPYYDINDL
ncbi:MAG: cache domain-containing protein, partial [Treponema sp.]|nr:cache domain-containing protein [Treponema sp.]